MLYIFICFVCVKSNARFIGIKNYSLGNNCSTKKIMP